MRRCTTPLSTARIPALGGKALDAIAQGLRQFLAGDRLAVNRQGLNCLGTGGSGSGNSGSGSISGCRCGDSARGAVIPKLAAAGAAALPGWIWSAWDVAGGALMATGLAPGASGAEAASAAWEAEATARGAAAAGGGST